MAFKMKGSNFYGSPMKQKTAEETEKETNNKARDLDKQTRDADDRGDALTAEISQAGFRKTLDTPQYKAARKEAATNRYHDRLEAKAKAKK